MLFEDPLRTRLQTYKTRSICEERRRKRILEALSWEKGTNENQRKHLVATLPNGSEVYFLKPGKEARPSSRRKKPNPHDMRPVVGDPSLKLTFYDVWAPLSQIGFMDNRSFRDIATLIYRNAYLLDHVETNAGIIRYKPKEHIVRQIDSEVSFSDFFRFDLIGLLHWFDILGWNEDVKYHVKDSQPSFPKGESSTGRINTLLTCIKVPYKISMFALHCVEKAADKAQIEFLTICKLMQQLSNSRGVAPATQEEIIGWLSPHIVKE